MQSSGPPHSQSSLRNRFASQAGPSATAFNPDAAQTSGPPEESDQDGGDRAAVLGSDHVRSRSGGIDEHFAPPLVASSVGWRMRGVTDEVMEGAYSRRTEELDPHLPETASDLDEDGNEDEKGRSEEGSGPTENGGQSRVRGHGSTADREEEGEEGNEERAQSRTDNERREDAYQDETICRICLGPQDEALGKLIAPCRCRGSMKYVHQKCIETWRSTSSRPSSFYQCDLCGAPFRYRRSRFIGLATNKFLLFFVSFFSFIALIFGAGFVAGWILDLADQAELSKSSEPIWSVSGGGVFGNTHVFTPGFGYWKLMEDTLRSFGSGQALRQVKRLVWGSEGDDEADVNEEVWMNRVDQGEMVEEEDFDNFFERVGDWLYGLDVDLPYQHAVRVDRFARRSRPYRNTGAGGGATKFQSSRTVRIPRQERHSSRRSKPVSTKAGTPRWLDRILYRFTLGFSFVGIVSFINMLLGISFFGPFHLGNFGLGRGLAWGRARRGGGGGGGDGGLASVIVVVLVVVGVIRAMVGLYRLIRHISRRLLLRVEEAIVDYSAEDETAVPPPPGAGPDPALQAIAREREERRGRERREEEEERLFQWNLARAGD